MNLEGSRRTYTRIMMEKRLREKILWSNQTDGSYVALQSIFQAWLSSAKGGNHQQIIRVLAGKRHQMVVLGYTSKLNDYPRVISGQAFGKPTFSWPRFIKASTESQLHKALGRPTVS